MSSEGGFEGLNREKLVWMYETMQTARRLDEKIVPLVKGSYHAGVGEEAIGAGAVAELRQDDYLMYSRRGCVQMIAKGVPPSKIAGDFIGTVEGATGGKGASIVHIADPARGVLGQSGTPGGAFPISVGAAMTITRRKTDQVVMCFFDGSTSNCGAFHESFKWASQRKLPVIFICQTKDSAAPAGGTSSVQESISARARGYNVPDVPVDGRDPAAVNRAVSEAVQRARRGGGPTLIEAKSSRFEDPIPLFRKRLLDAAVATEAEIWAVDQRVEANLDEAIRKAKAAPLPDPSYIYADVYSE